LLQDANPRPIPLQYEDSTQRPTCSGRAERGGAAERAGAALAIAALLDQARFAEPALSVRGVNPGFYSPITCGQLPGRRLPYPRAIFEHQRNHALPGDLPWQLAPLEPEGGKGRGWRLSLTDTAATLAAFRFSLHLQTGLSPSKRAGPGDQQVGNRELRRTSRCPQASRLHPYFMSRRLRPRGWHSEGGCVKRQPVETLCGCPPGDCPNTVQHLTMAREATAAPAAAAVRWRFDLLGRPCRKSVAAAGSRLRLSP